MEDKEDKHKDEHEDHNNGSHHNHHEMMIKDFKRRLFISLIVTVPILVLSPMIQEWTNMEVSFPGSKYVLLGLATFIYFYGGWPFLKGLVEELKDKAPGMMTLIAMAITVVNFIVQLQFLDLKEMIFFGNLQPL